MYFSCAEYHSHFCTFTEKISLDSRAARPPAWRPLPTAPAPNPAHCASAHGFYRGEVSFEGLILHMQRKKAFFFWQIRVHQISSPCQ